MDLSITVDVEKDVGAVETCYGIDEGLPAVLDLMNEFNAKATFFISGEILDYLEKTGNLKRILDNNYEIASHGYRHLDYRDWEEEKIFDEIMRSKEEIKKVTGVDVVGYRSPQFRVNEKIVNVLKKLGFKYDSSIPDPKGFSAASLLRGVKFDSEILKRVNDENFREFTISSVPVIKMPHGIFWINFIGFDIYRYLFKKFNEDVIVLYMHPFDFIKYKSRVKCPTMLENILYPVKEKNVLPLFRKLMSFWKNEQVNIKTLIELL